MKSPRTRAVAIVVLLAIAIGLWCSGCSVKQQTVTPPAIVSTQASFDGNQQNSGLIGPDDKGGFYVTPRFIARYDSLLVKYGERLSPPVKPGDRRGITEHDADTIQVTAEMVARFRTLNLWRKADQAP